ncbi:MAG: glycosyltransferase family 4 protein [Candidatus Omnitrophica bacterium]|nr:glycosyltransferase family 4 protein [Candidatus Omnitrophota bacterium]
MSILQRDSLRFANRPLKILMVISLPWKRELGASRVMVELSDEYKRMGHYVEKFSFEDAFAFGQSRLSEARHAFIGKVKQFLVCNAHRFDIIEIYQTDCCFSKKDIQFVGLLVLRSAGLLPIYQDYERKYQLHGFHPTVRGFISFCIAQVRKCAITHCFWQGVHSADMIVVPNEEEATFLRKSSKLRGGCHCFPFGLPEERRLALHQAMQPPEVRLRNKEVVFIGHWDARKGSRDWPAIMRLTQERVPGVRFKFLGTGVRKEDIFLKLPEALHQAVDVIFSFSNDELPMFLASSTVGAFPSYVEGFGFAIIEKLASGIPVIAYDAIGARQILHDVKDSCLIAIQDTKSFAEALVRVLLSSESEYAALSQQSLSLAARFQWETIANETLALYRRHLVDNAIAR